MVFETWFTVPELKWQRLGLWLLTQIFAANVWWSFDLKWSTDHRNQTSHCQPHWSWKAIWQVFSSVRICNHHSYRFMWRHRVQPGPIPCAMCSDDATLQEKTVCCDACNQWTNTKCNVLLAPTQYWGHVGLPQHRLRVPNHSSVLSSTQSQSTTQSREAHTSPPEIAA